MIPERGKVVELAPQVEELPVYKRCIELVAAGEIDEAYKAVEGILEKDPNDAQALTVAASILKRAKKIPLAYSLAKRATELRPDRPEAWDGLGECAQSLWRHDEAQSFYTKALKRAKTKQQRALYLNNLSSVLLDLGRFVEAEPYCWEGLEILPEDKSLRHNVGLSLLAQRRWREAWPYYSASVGTARRLLVKYRKPPEPPWDGTKGKTVVVYGEQGLGDEICAASMLPDAIADCGKVIIDCDARLAPLFRRSFPQAVVYGTRWAKREDGQRWAEKPEELDCSIPGFELARFYRNETSAFPGTPYLTPCPDRTAMWRALFADKRPVIGIAWTGGTFQNAGLYRQLPLAEWKPIFEAVDAHWVCLQYKDASKDIEGTPVKQYAYATLTKDYDDTCALVAACDLVIGMQTSVIHLAGALGVPTWSMIPKTSQWRYGEEYTDLPWYRSVKLYRQTGEWAPVVKRIAHDLSSHFS